MSEAPTVVAISSTPAFPPAQYLVTAPGVPNVAITIVTPIVAIIVRAAKAYLQTLTGLLAAGGLGMAPSVLPAGDFMNLFWKCAALSVASGIMSILTNMTLLMTTLSDKFPTLKS